MKKLTTFSLALLLIGLLLAPISVSAATPTIEDVEYSKQGRIELDFRQNVQYRNFKITVRDIAGKVYAVQKIHRDSDEVDFTIKNFAPGKTYRITLQGIRSSRSGTYGKVSQTIKVPAATSNSSKQITSKQAIAITQADAQKRGASRISDLDVELDRYRGDQVYEISFDAQVKHRSYEFEYLIAKNSGKILDREISYDD